MKNVMLNLSYYKNQFLFFPIAKCIGRSKSAIKNFLMFKVEYKKKNLYDKLTHKSERRVLKFMKL